MAEKLNFNIQYTHRLMLGDHLEGKLEFDNPIPKTTANLLNNDKLSGLSIGISYDFWVRSCDCPGGTFDNSRKPAAQKTVKQRNPREETQDV